MKRKILSILLVLSMALTLLPTAVLADEGTTSGEDAGSIPEGMVAMYTIGSDTEVGYDATEFEITSVADLQAFAAMVNQGKDFSNKTVTLKTNLDLSSVENWTPIGSVDLLSEDEPDEGDCPFAGTFDGGNYKISNLTISYGIKEDDPLYDYGGLFGYVTGSVKKVTLENVNLKAASDSMGGIAGALGTNATIEDCGVSGVISGAEYDNEAYGSFVGGIVGYSEGTIKGCTSSCTISDALYQVGGIAGGTDGGTITGCKNTGSIKGLGMTGGIVGEADDSEITDCSNSGTVTGEKNTTNTRENRRVGGIVGDTQATTIANCENTGTVTAEELTEVGGIVGYLYYGSTVEGCSNAGGVKGGDSTGGIVGFASAYSTEGYEVKNCTNTGPVDGDSGVGGVVGVSTANNNSSSTQEIVGCTNSGAVSGESDVGGIVGEHNSDEVITSSGTKAATVSGCVNTGAVSATGTSSTAGAIVGNNNNAKKDSEGEGKSCPGNVENNFWPESLGTSAIGSGAGSSTDSTAETVKNNSAYKPDGTLTTPIITGAGNEQKTITTISAAVKELLGGNDEEGDDKTPAGLKATATFNNGGHGAAPESQTVVIGTEITLPAMNNSGYWTFLNWTAGGQTYEANTAYKVTTDVTFTANWRNDTPSGGGSYTPPTYSVTAPKADNGSVTVSPKSASKGDTVTVTVKPDEGYELDALTVTDRNGKEIELTDKGDGKYTFTMPSGRVEVKASFAKEIETSPFADVATDAYYYEAVKWAVKNGITTGVGDNLFAPGQPCTRAQIVTFLWRAAGSPEPKGTAAGMTDVVSGSYYEKAVAWAIENGVTTGTTATTFSPDATCTRAQAVTFLARALNAKAASAAEFSDVPTDSYFANAVAWAAANGVTEGVGNGMFAPDNDCTRGQIVTFLYRAYNK